MNILLIGGNSYIAHAFIDRFDKRFAITPLKRDATLSDYFDLNRTHFSGYDAVLNCAAIVHTRAPDPALTRKINADLPLYLARLAKEAGVPHFVQLSTVAVYGNAEYIDSATPESPDTVYGKTKLQGDRNLLSLQDNTFIVSLIRPPMVYGPDAPGNLEALIRLIRRCVVLPFDYRNNHRSLIYIDNLLNAIEGVIRTQTGGIVLVRDNELPSLSELSGAIVSALNLKCRLFSPPRSLITMLCRFPSLPFAKLYGSLVIDDSRTRSRIGEYALISLAEGIRQTVQRSRHD